MTKKTHHTSLGFVFGYKESNESIVDGKTIFNIKFKKVYQKTSLINLNILKTSGVKRF